MLANKLTVDTSSVYSCSNTKFIKPKKQTVKIGKNKGAGTQDQDEEGYINVGAELGMKWGSTMPPISSSFW